MTHAASAAVTSDGLPASPDGWAFFFDIDGTLIDIAATPGGVIIPPGLPSDLERLVERTGGATAVISGRSIEVIDQFFAPARLPAGGVHGAELRFRDGTMRRLQRSPAMPEIRRRLDALAAAHPEILIEDKGIALAAHYRAKPALAEAVLAAATDAVALGTGELTIQEGKMVVEIRPTAASKAHALEAFLESPDFAGRRPVAVGDDLTDEHMFAAAVARGGIAVRVGEDERDSLAAARLPDPAATRAFLARLVAA